MVWSGGDGKETLITASAPPIICKGVSAEARRFMQQSGKAAWSTVDLSSAAVLRANHGVLHDDDPTDVVSQSEYTTGCKLGALSRFACCPSR